MNMMNNDTFDLLIIVCIILILLSLQALAQATYLL